jgi:hypothetical protein
MFRSKSGVIKCEYSGIRKIVVDVTPLIDLGFESQDESILLSRRESTATCQIAVMGNGQAEVPQEKPKRLSKFTQLIKSDFFSDAEFWKSLLASAPARTSIKP